MDQKMELTYLTVECDNTLKDGSTCQHPNKRVIKIYDPDDFSPDGSKSVLSQYWCEKCQQIQMIRYEFYRENEEIKARLKNRLEPNPLTVAKRDSTGITVRPRSCRK